MNIVQKAIKKIGTQEELSNQLANLGMPIKQPSISEWVKNGRVSVRYAPVVEALTGIDRRDLCPDHKWDIKVPKRKKQARGDA